MKDPFSVPAVTKIAIVNPYLLRGLVESSEVEACMRFISAAKNLGIEAKVFSKTDDVYDFQPDFVIPISHQEPKLTPYPTYGLLINPLKWTMGSQRFMRNIFTYDAFFVVTPNVNTWLKDLCRRSNKILYVANAAFSVPQTILKSLEFKNATAAYMGVNWDGTRHFDLFKHLATTDLVKCYGPKESWMKYPANLYGGMIPFDGTTALHTYAKHGIGLGINHPDMDNEGIPTCRTFEIAAASAISIFAKNSYIEKQYGDSAFYVDKNTSTQNLAAEIINIINWVRSHPRQAQEMAKSAHDIFNNQLSLEFFISNMVNMHNDVLASKGFLKSKPVSAEKRPKVTYFVYVENIDAIENLVRSIKNQTYNNINLILLADLNNKNAETALKGFESNNISVMHYNGINCNATLMNMLLNNDTEWFGILNNYDVLFPNHVSILMKRYANSQHNKNKEASVAIFSSHLEHSSVPNLPDKIQDNHLMYLANSIRVGNITPCGNIPLCAAVMKMTPLTHAIFKNTDFSKMVRINFAENKEPLDIALHANEITCSFGVMDNKNQGYLVIKNATSPLNFSNYHSFTQGSLLVDERQRQKLLQL